jgi:gliding motility-associated-like protein
MKSTYTQPRMTFCLNLTSVIKCLTLLFITTVFSINISMAQCGPGAAVQTATAPTGATDPSWTGIYKNVIGANPNNTVTNNSGNIPPIFSSDGFPLLGSSTAREADFGSPTWQAQWTTTTVYILVTVPDLTVNFDPIPSDTFFYNYDAVEVYLSGNNAHAGPPYGTDDVQYGFSNGVFKGVSSGAGTSTTGVSGVHTLTPGGYTMFITIPLASFSSPTAMNSQVSFDVAVDDNDHLPNIATKMAIDSAFLRTPAGGNHAAGSGPGTAQFISQGFRSGGDYRDAQVAWHSTTGQAPYSTTSNLGDLKLTAPPTVAAGNTQTLCGSGFITLAGTNPAVGTGTWTATGGIATLGDLSSPSVTTPNFTPFGGTGLYVYTWTISNAFCTAMPSTHADDTVFVKAVVTPTFNSLADICTGAATPVIPTMSTNPITPITGTWSPMPVDNTTTGAYLFTPTPGLCANFVTLVQTVLPNTIVPTFNPLATICNATAPPTLQSTSNNSIAGVWNPATVSNTGNGTYTFTPNPGQCALTNTITESVTTRTTPTFTALPAICTGATAPVLNTTSNNGITGTWSPFPVSNTTTGTYTFTPTAGLCANPATIVQTINPPTTIPTFTALPAICKGTAAPVLQNPSNNGITGTWSPAIVSNTTSGTYTFTPTPGQCAFTATITQVINNPITPVFNPLPAICNGATAPTLPGSSTDAPPITGTWNPSTVNNTAPGTYTFTPTAGQCATTTTLTETIKPSTIIPVFTPLAAICSGATAPTLPGSSNDIPPVTGTWNPSTVNNIVAGTYTFTPATGQCALKTTLTEAIKPSTIIPAFTPLPAICSGATAPTLPGSSNDIPPITGTWNPSTVNNTTAGTYTFTPATGQCALKTTLTQAIKVSTIVPIFNPLPGICSGATAPILPGSSTDAPPITGVWSPAGVNNTTSGTYTFTPNTGQCALTTTLVETITPSTIPPTFNPLPPICSGATAPVLPTTSLNSIAGSWSPMPVSNTATATYTFIPTTGLCATTGSLVQTIIAPTVPAFAPLPAICMGAPAPTLPGSSTDAPPITGSWLPASVSNTATSTYTFIPTAGQCATSTTIVQAVNSGSITPTFTPLAAICNGSVAPVLPTTSLNSITGAWSPMPVNNTITATYTFTPVTGQCATTATIVQTVNNPVTPTFIPLTAICTGATAPTLPTSSTNAITITGTWLPTPVSNATTATYTFTPTAGQCALTTTIVQTIKPATITPTFTALAAICVGGTAPVLPASSTDAPPITGSWNPAAVNNISTGTYTFTPAIGQCALTTSIVQSIITPALPTFSPLAAICVGGTAPTLPASSTDAPPITGSWNPAAVSNAATGTYTFTPTAGQCATTTTLVQTINVGTVTPTFTALPAICNGSTAPVLPISSIESITGSWLPAPVSNTTTATYTFTPDPGQCALTTSIVQTIIAPTTPTFNALPAICTGATAPVLPTASTNATPINGSWLPAPVSNTATATYTFTPTAGQCATKQSIVQTINAATITPTFIALPAICNGSAAPALAGTSTNAIPITGTWSPASVNNTTTATYTFIPDPGQCSLTNTLVQTIIAPTVPTFNALTAICNGSVAPVLPTASTNAAPINGSWLPVSVDNTITATYTFIPTAGQCATTQSIVQTVTPNVTPAFTALLAICAGAIAPALPASSNNAPPISGTWNPAAVSNAITGTYTFTPTAGICATTQTIVQTITPNVTPTFNTLSAICANSIAPVLPTSSTNTPAINGTWLPASVSNVATGTYTFTPTAGVCATTQTIVQTVTPNVTPTFTALPAICANATVPLLQSASNDTPPITGTWNPSTVNNVSTTTYVFTPTTGLCALTQSLVQTVVPNITPSFNALPNICSGNTAPILPTASNDAPPITGTWNPATVSNTTTGIYTFTPTAGLCAITTTATQVVYLTPVLAIKDPNGVCAGGHVSIADSSVAFNNSSLPAGSVPTYYEPAPDSTTVLTSDPSTISIAGTYYVSYTTPAPAGCPSAKTPVPVTIYPELLPPTPGPAQYCQFDNTSALTASGPGTFVWYTQPVGGDSSFTAPVPPTNDGGVTLKYYVGEQQIFGSTSCVSDTRNELDVRVTEKPTASVTPSNIEVYANQSITFEGFATGGPVNWVINDSLTGAPLLPNPSDSTQTLIPPSSINPPDTTTTYYLVVVSPENNSCKAIAFVKVKVLQPLIIPNIFSPNGDQFNQTWDIGNIQEFDNAEVSIFNRYGQFIYRSTDGYKTPWNGTYQGSPLPVGTYFYIIKTSINAAPISGYVAIVR